MRDIREEIIARLLVVVTGVDGIASATRNVHVFDDMDMPAAAVLDGDEDAVEDEPTRRPVIPRRYEMSPLVLVSEDAQPETLGSSLNTLRRKVIHAVLTDSTLLSLVDRHGIRYDGLSTPRHENGRMMLGQKVMRFTFTYLLDPQDLT